jgi:anti-anti-sigma factor
MTAVLLNVDAYKDGIVPALKEAARDLDKAPGEIVLDFSCLRRIDSSGLRALTEFAQQAEEKSAKVVIRGANIDVYKVLKLMKLTRRFSFIN